MEGFLVIGGILVFVVGIYVLTYYLNTKIEVPKGIEPASCDTCNSSSCTLRKTEGPIDSENCDIEMVN